MRKSRNDEMHVFFGKLEPSEEQRNIFLLFADMARELSARFKGQWDGVLDWLKTEPSGLTYELTAIESDIDKKAISYLQTGDGIDELEMSIFNLKELWVKIGIRQNSSKQGFVQGRAAV